MKERTITHLNIIGFKSAVAAVKDKSLRGRPYVIAGAGGRNLASGRCLALDCSPEAVRQGVTPGMTLSAAQRRVSDLIILPPDLPSYELMNNELEKAAAQYAPVWENDRAGNLYLDITGTTSLFGPPVDCSSRILNDILDQVNIKPAAAVACNKLTSKVATRVIRPTGLIQVQSGTERDFLSHQDIRLLPGMGTKLLKTAAVVGIREIGEVAVLSETEALSLFGKHGTLLRSMALGIDNTPVTDRNGKHNITQRADFNEDVIDNTAIMGAIEFLVEHGGLKMRNEKLGTRTLRLVVLYSDGVEVQGIEKTKRLLVTDREIMTTTTALYQKTVSRRIRIRSIGLGFEDLTPLGYQPDLFVPETETANQRLQETVDKIRNRYGEGKITRGLVFAASKTQGAKQLISAGGKE